MISQDLAELTGPTIGGLLISALGVAKSFYTNGATFFFSAVSIWVLPIGRSDQPAVDPPTEKGRCAGRR